jgi:hypothetical protein
MWDAIERFLTRPYGGMEAEAFVSRIEVLIGVLLIVNPENLTALRMAPSQALEFLPWPLLGSVWIGAGLVKLVGIWLALMANHACAPVRWVGSIISCLAWGWSLMFMAMSPDRSIFMMLLSADAMLLSFRFMVGAWSRPWG